MLFDLDFFSKVEKRMSSVEQVSFKVWFFHHFWPHIDKYWSYIDALGSYFFHVLLVLSYFVT